VSTKLLLRLYSGTEPRYRYRTNHVQRIPVLLTWGNASIRHPSEPVMAIKPSGVAYEELSPEAMVLVSIETGEVVEGTLRPSSDTDTHLEIYRAFPAAQAVSSARPTPTTSVTRFR